jgi:hypothetical protein
VHDPVASAGWIPADGVRLRVLLAQERLLALADGRVLALAPGLHEVRWWPRLELTNPDSAAHDGAIHELRSRVTLVAPGAGEVSAEVATTGDFAAAALFLGDEQEDCWSAERAPEAWRQALASELVVDGMEDLWDHRDTVAFDYDDVETAVRLKYQGPRIAIAVLRAEADGDERCDRPAAGGDRLVVRVSGLTDASAEELPPLLYLADPAELLLPSPPAGEAGEPRLFDATPGAGDFAGHEANEEPA